MGLDAVELLMELEKQFEIEISDADAATLHTVGDLFEVVLAKRKIAPDSALARDQVWPRFVELVAKDVGVSPTQVVPSARLVEDLGLS